MALPDAGVSTRVIRPILAGLMMHGVDPAPLLVEAKLDPERVADLAARVPHGAAIALWDQAVEATGVATLGLRVAEAMDLAQFDVQSYAFLNAPNLGEGLRTLVRYQRLNHDAATLSLIEADGLLLCRHTLPGAYRLPAAAAQFVLGVAVLAIRMAVGPLAGLVDVRFQHAAPDDPSDYARVLQVPVAFDQSHNEVAIAGSALSRPHLGADPALRMILERHGDAMLAALPRITDFVDRVRTLLAQELQGGNPSAEHIAERLHMSTRTLARRLKSEGTSHREQLDELRHDLALRYFSDPKLSVGEVAFLLGFSEPSAFHRAFKRWTGRTPSQVRSEP